MNKDTQAKLAEIQKAINKRKTEVLTEYEKICPTEMSFNRMKKQEHDGFDALYEAIKFIIQ